MKRRELIIILPILFLALVKYAYQGFVLNPFEIDQEFLAMEAWNFLKNGNPTLIGAHTSVGGMYIGPGYTYLVYLVMWLTKLNPYSINALSVLWTTLTAITLYFIGKKLFSREVGIVAGLLAATSISYLNITEVPPLVIPLGLVSLLTFYCLSQIKTNRRMLFYSWLLAMIAIHLHFTGIYLVIFIIFWIAVNKIKLFTKNILIGSLMVLISATPLILFDLRHNFLNSRNFITFLLTTNGIKILIWSVGRSFMLALGNLGALFNNFQNYNTLVSSIVWIIFIFYFISKRHRSPHYPLTIAWMIFPVVFNGLYTGELLPYYYIFHHPQIFLVIAFLLEPVTKRQWGCTILLALAMMYTLLNLRWLHNHQNAFSLQNKMAGFSKIKELAGNPTDVNLSLTVDHARRGGIDYLRRYYGFDDKLLSTRRTYTIVIPHYWHRVVADYTFGEVDVVLPEKK